MYIPNCWIPHISPLKGTHPGFKQTVGEFCGVSVAQGEFDIFSKTLAHIGRQRERSEEGKADQRERPKIWMNICPQNCSLKIFLKGLVAQSTFWAVGAPYQEFHKYYLMSSLEQIISIGIIFPIGQVPIFFSLNSVGNLSNLYGFRNFSVDLFVKLLTYFRYLDPIDERRNMLLTLTWSIAI